MIRSAHELSFRDIEAIRRYLRKRWAITLDTWMVEFYDYQWWGVWVHVINAHSQLSAKCWLLGMHNIVKRPMVIGDEIKIRPMMYLAVSYDHRIIDGSDAVRFVAIKDRLEDPSRLLIGL